MIDRRNRYGPAPLIAVMIASAIVLLISGAIDLRELTVTFVVAYAALVSVALGTLAMSLIAQLTTATWYGPFRSRAHVVIASLPALAAMSILLMLSLPSLYPWMGADTAARSYLNVPFFIVRTIIYWIVWIGVGQAFLRATRHGNPARLRRVASGGLVALGITMTFASFDWLMSLTPDWHSTAYGVYWFAGGILSALALLAVMAPFSHGRLGWMPLRGDDTHALGKLLTTFLLFWVYIGFSQYIVIWSGDIPREVTWYVPRTHGGWGYVGGVLVLGGFVFPFLALLFVPVRRSPRVLAAVGAWLLAIHWLDTFWMVLPGLVPVRLWTVVVAAAAFVLVSAAMWLFVSVDFRRWRPGSVAGTITNSR
jgi:hypothetical protein